MLYPWLVYIHVLGVFGFIMAHGLSIAVAFSLRRERNLERIRTLLNLSSGSIGMMNSSIIILLLTGIVSGFIGRWWNRGWIWLSLGLLIAIAVYMGVSGLSYYAQVRKAVGEEKTGASQLYLLGEAVSSEQINALLNQPRPLWLAVCGFGSLVVITWLMIFKPF